MNMIDLLPALPEIILFLGACILLMVGVFLPKERIGLIYNGALVVLLSASITLFLYGDIAISGFDGSLVMDDFGVYCKLLIFISSAIILAMSRNFFDREKINQFEFPVLLLLANAGMSIMVSAYSLIAIYMGIELMSLPLYVMAAMKIKSLRSGEAGLKYFVLGALSSGILLYGCALIYGFTGTIYFDAINEQLKDGGASLGVIFGLVFLLAGFAFKISAVPFHMWTPDVYEGAPTPITSFFAAAPKMAAIALLVRLMVDGFQNIESQWQQIIIFLSAASMILGALAGLRQKNIKRLMAYSSIGHMGFALIGLAAYTRPGIEGLLLYMTIYLVMTLGTFACILSMRTREGMVENIDDLAGLAQGHPVMAFFLSACIFSLAGIPPLAGFFGKFFILSSAIESNMLPLAIIGVLASVVAAFYYLRIVKLIYFDDPNTSFLPPDKPLGVVMVLAGLFVVLFFLMPSPLLNEVSEIATSLLQHNAHTDSVILPSLDVPWL